jgi:hypothetical protein
LRYFGSRQTTAAAKPRPFYAAWKAGMTVHPEPGPQAPHFGTTIHKRIPMEGLDDKRWRRRGNPAGTGIRMGATTSLSSQFDVAKLELLEDATTVRAAGTRHGGKL